MGRRADLKTGYDCNSNCVFCVIGDKLFTGDRPTDELVAELQRSRATCDDVVFTGAEVTIRPDFLQLVATAKRLGYRGIQIQTNGRMFAYRELCEQAVAAGANEFSPSIHGHIARLHDGLTRSKGSFEQIVRAIEHLVALRQRVVTNTVITKQNAAHLPALATMLVELGVDQFQLAFPHPTGHADTHFQAVVPRMSAIAPFVHEALAIGASAGVDCMAEAIPFCHMGGHEARVAELHIPPTEIVYDGFVVPDYGADRMDRGKTRFSQCATCRFEPICEGPWKEYPARVGDDEFQPLAGPKVVDPMLVLDPRFTLLGRCVSWPSPVEFETPYLAVMVYPEDGSPSCTTQARSVRDGADDLRAAGVTLWGVSPDDAPRHEAFAREHGLRHRLIPDPDLAWARAVGATDDHGRLVRTTVLVGSDHGIAHVIVDPRVDDHAGQIRRAVARLQAGPRPVGPRDDLVVIRRAPARSGPARSGEAP